MLQVPPLQSLPLGVQPVPRQTIVLNGQPVRGMSSPTAYPCRPITSTPVLASPGGPLRLESSFRSVPQGVRSNSPTGISTMSSPLRGLPSGCSSFTPAELSLQRSVTTSSGISGMGSFQSGSTVLRTPPVTSQVLSDLAPVAATQPGFTKSALPTVSLQETYPGQARPAPAWKSTSEGLDVEEIPITNPGPEAQELDEHGAFGYVRAPTAEETLSGIPQSLSASRVARPHGFFPFDFLSWDNLVAHDGWGLSKHVMEELSYVRDHCMIPPFPWGQVIYHKLIMEHIIANEIEGDFGEFGIGLGGTSIFFARLAKAYGRKFLSVDSFEGLPPPDLSKENHYFLEGDYKPKPGQDNYDRWVKYKSKFDVDDMLVTLKGFFKDVTIPPGFTKLAFVHLDSDLYDSVYDSLEKIWDYVVEGGIIAIDDFFHHAQGPARAVSDFFRTRCSEPPLVYVVPTYAVLIMKGRSACLQASQTRGDRSLMHSPRALDGNFYSFKLIRQCAPLVRAAQASVEKARKAHATADASQKSALSRCLKNAEDFYAFVRYPDQGSRSGVDILRYLAPLEDQWDIYQGNLCGMPEEERKLMMITI